MSENETHSDAGYRGCRAVVSTAPNVNSLSNYYQKVSAIKHELASEDDYIASPQKTGYRGVHLVYRYFSDKQATSIYNGLKIEMQLRSQYQHAWATAVETVGTFVQEALKSSMGSEEWLRFFALMGSAIALREGTPLVPDTPTTRNELIRDLAHYTGQLNVVRRLQAYGDALKRIEGDTQNAHYYLLQLDPGARQLLVTGFKANEAEEAQDRYTEAERQCKDKPGTDAVLVSVESVAALPRAYPNYFADTRVFVTLLLQALSGVQRRIQTKALPLFPHTPG
ncbi:MAG: RelA/SpoT domain-containing protein [Microvirga sp.]|nr:RelA/SpoT domain-containing protein [Beijerinckiaceae bacterium]